MKHLFSLVLFLSFLQFGVAVAAEKIEWDELVDKEAQVFEDPYADLQYDQIDSLKTVIAKRAKLEDPSLTSNARAAAERALDAAVAHLADTGIDADWLISQRWIVADRREKAATAANPGLDGQSVKLAGYAIPAPMDADGTRIVYLVPERGMCSHMPPPNANQMVRARLTGDWNPSTMHEPVRLTGTLSVEETKYAFRIVDGEVLMRASYLLDVTGVEPIKDMSADTPAVNKWAASMAARLRASGQLKDNETSDEQNR